MTDRDVNWLLDQVLENAGDSWDQDAAAESIAVDYVRHLEAEVRRLGGCPSRPFMCYPCDHAPADLDRDFWGRIVRDEWVKWALEQDDPEDSWLVPWDDLDAGQREVDERMGAAVAAVAREGERRRLLPLLREADRHITYLSNLVSDHTDLRDWDDGPDLEAAITELSAGDHV